MSQVVHHSAWSEVLTESFNQRVQRLPNDQNSFFYQVRKRALTNFNQLGLPTLKNEAYKYTPITGVLSKTFDFRQPPTTPTLTSKAIEQALFNTMDAHHIVLLNGKFSEKHSFINGQRKDLVILNFQEAYRQYGEVFRNHFARHANDETDAFTALNTALFEDGVFIKVADHTVIEKPLIVYHITDANLHNTITYPRLLVLAGEHSQCSVGEFYPTVGTQASFVNTVSEIMLAENAHVAYYKLQTHKGNAYQVGNTQCYQAKQSVLNTYTITLEGVFMRNNLNVVLNAEHCETNMYGLYLLRRKQHVDNHTTVDHQKPHAFSNELYKGIINEQATGVFNGKIYVRPHAQKTNAFQSNNNILLSKYATIHAKPQLEIWADDVKCSHGSTTGQLDRQQLFYLRARGIHEKTARNILLKAFAHEVIEKVRLAALKDYLNNALDEKLNALHS